MPPTEATPPDDIPMNSTISKRLFDLYHLEETAYFLLVDGLPHIEPFHLIHVAVFLAFTSIITSLEFSYVSPKILNERVSS